MAGRVNAGTESPRRKTAGKRAREKGPVSREGLKVARGLTSMAEAALAATVVETEMDLGGGEGGEEAGELAGQLVDGQLELRVADETARAGGGGQSAAAVGGGEDDVLVTEPVLGMRMLMSSRVRVCVSLSVSLSLRTFAHAVLYTRVWKTRIHVLCKM